MAVSARALPRFLAVDTSRLASVAAAATTAGAGALHVAAAQDHSGHALVVAFFVTVAALQLTLAPAVAGRRLQWAAIVLNTAVIGTWVASRTTGIPGVEGAADPEAVGGQDLAATLLELAAVAALVRVRWKAAVVTGLAVAVATAALAAPTTGGHSHVVAGDQERPRSIPVTTASGDVFGERTHFVPITDDLVVTDPEDSEAAPAPDGPGDEVQVRYGPFTLTPAAVYGPGEADGSALSSILTNLPPPCEDCYMTAAVPELVYPDGSAANLNTGVMLHHTVLFDSSQDDPTCDRTDTTVGRLGRRVLASGDERTGGAYPEGFGQYVPAGARWTGVFEIMNHSERTQEVFFQLTVSQVDEAKAITPVWLDVSNCESSEFSVPAGRSETTWDWESNLTGRIVAAGGHLHDGGVAITLDNTTTGDHVCTSAAAYGTEGTAKGHLDTMSGCRWDSLGALRRGDTLRLTTVYDVDEPLDDVMGIMMVFVHETDDLDGGTAPPPGATTPEALPTPPPVTAGHH